MAPPKDKQTPLPHTHLDLRINDIPIPLKSQDDNIHIQNSLLPYFALGFIPVRTGGAADHTCGLHALMISYNAARKQFYQQDIANRDEDNGDTDAQGEEEGLVNTSELQDTTLAQWKNWLNSAAYKAARQKFMKSLPNVYDRSTAKERQVSVKEWQEKANIDENVLGVLLSMANENYGTSFRLGILEDGWRGRWERHRNPTEAQRDDNGLAPVSKVFNNAFLCNAKARMTNVDVGHGPVIWIKNDNHNQRLLDHEDVSGENHWEGFAPSEDKPGIDNRRKAVQEYGIGARLEADIKNGVWFATKDFSKDDQPGCITASAGCFLRPQAQEYGKPNPDWRLVKTCNDKGWIRKADVVEVGIAAIAPHATTDPSLESMQLPPCLPLPGLGPIPPKTKNINKNTGGKEGKKNDDELSYTPCTPYPQGRLPFENGPFKLFRVLPPTDKASMFIHNPPEQDFNNEEFEFKNGDFVLDLGEARVDLKVKVRDIHGHEESVPLRRLQALKNPWGYPDKMPFSNLDYYSVPEKKSSAKVLAEFHGFTDLDFDSKDARGGLQKRMHEKAFKECPKTILYRVMKTVKEDGRIYKGSREEGEIVRKMSSKESGKGVSHVVVNYEGYKHLIPDDGMEKVAGEFWGMYINLAEWRDQKKKLKCGGGTDADQSDKENETALGANAKKVVDGEQIAKETNGEAGHVDAVLSDDEADNQADQGNRGGIAETDESEEE